MRQNPRIGLLPLYLKLYNDCMPDMRPGFDPFLQQVAAGLEQRDVEVVRADVCCLKGEFKTAVAGFEKRDVDLIVTVHLAYSPSLECTDELIKTTLPILILDTTMDAAFGRDVKADRIFYNHGIHGVMDMASMLRRRGKRFRIVAGHITDSNVMERAAAVARAAYAARCLRRTKALRIGETFKGMGDFSVAETVMRDTLGIVVKQIDAADLALQVEKVAAEEIEREIALDREQFVCELPEEVHKRSVRVSLGLRRKLEAKAYSAFSMNFLAFDKGDGPVNTVPFLEASKAMARGIGYAGEGDVLTAALVGALSRGFGKTTFTEIFCPDWKGNSLFLSHMGEINPEVAAERPRLVEKPFPFTAAQNPAVITCAPKPGPAVFVNLAPGPDNTFSLIVAPVEVLGDATGKELRNSVRGWIRPGCGVAAFLEVYSRHGGTHHSALVLGNQAEAIAGFAQFSGIECCMIT